jgi:hypothetical protein
MNQEQNDSAFVVRIWWDVPTGGALSAWRGLAQNVGNGNYASFKSLIDLIDFLEQETGQHPLAVEPGQGLS